MGLRTIGEEKGVSGIVILVTKDPGYLQVATVGDKTRQHSFTIDDRDALNAKMLSLLNVKQHDDALLTGVDFIKERMRRSQSNAAAPSQNSSGSTNYPPPPIVTTPTGFPVGAFICAGIAILGIVFLIMSIVNRSRGYGGVVTAAASLPADIHPAIPAAIRRAAITAVGAAVDSEADCSADSLGGAARCLGLRRIQPVAPPTKTITRKTLYGGDFGNSSDQTDTSYSGTGGDFGSSSNDSSNSGGGGGDFGSSSDSGGGGSDFGGGGGGGGDFGGGGDSGGGSSGGDF